MDFKNFLIELSNAIKAFQDRQPKGADTFKWYRAMPFSFQGFSNTCKALYSIEVPPHFKGDYEKQISTKKGELSLIMFLLSGGKSELL